MGGLAHRAPIAGRPRAPRPQVESRSMRAPARPRLFPLFVTTECRKNTGAPAPRAPQLRVDPRRIEISASASLSSVELFNRPRRRPQ